MTSKPAASAACAFANSWSALPEPSWYPNRNASTLTHAGCPLRRDIARHLWGAADERQQLGLDVCVIRDVDARPVVAALAQRLVHRKHAFEHGGALVRVERLVLAGGTGEIPAMQED